MSCVTCLNDRKISNHAELYCFQCRILQCHSCDKILHENKTKTEHVRLNLTEIEHQLCTVDRCNPAIFYCSSCTAWFCLPCWISEHQRGEERQHLGQKYANESQMTDVSLYPTLSTDQIPQASAPIFQYYSNDGVVFLLNDAEAINFVNADEFIYQLKPTSNDPTVKCVSIIGNTSNGKSQTLNHVFFHNKDKFKGNNVTDSCNMGVWAALSDNQSTLVLDTQGQLSTTLNDNLRSRVLLKVMCLSDIIIYRTNAPKLTYDMFRFLSDLSISFEKNFQKEFENIETTSNHGPCLIIFHETQHTEILKDDFRHQMSPVDQLTAQFNKLGLSYSAYQSIVYVGTQTTDGKQTDFRELKRIVSQRLQDNAIRSARPLSIVFKALQDLNDKFSQTIPTNLPSILPKEFFTCSARCSACDEKCDLSSGHDKSDLPHHTRSMCIYNKQLDNEIMKCTKCDRDGLDTAVFGKLIARDDGLVQGLVRYVWSGFVIECPRHGEIYRSRKFWYGNDEPKSVTRLQIVHAWPGEEFNRFASDVTARKVVDIIRSASSYISASAVPIKEKLADQIAPAYWVPNSEMHDCYSCKLQFGTEYPKHHCRACGYIFCDSCTTHRARVPLLNSNGPERVCNACYDDIQKKALTFQSQQSELTENEPIDSEELRAHPSNSLTIPMSRRILEFVQNNIVYAAYEYPKTLISEGTRPNYWRADDECKACCVCQHAFNTTTHRLHHCRRCGEGVCDECSPNKLPVPERDWLTPERVCKTCESILTQSTTD